MRLALTRQPSRLSITVNAGSRNVPGSRPVPPIASSEPSADLADSDNVTLPVGSATASTPCARSSQTPLAPSAPTRADAETIMLLSESFLQHVLQNRPILPG